MWWYNHGVTAGVHVSAILRPEAGRPALMRLLREALERVVGAGVDEAFLIRSLMVDLDEHAERLGDTGASDAYIDKMRADLLKITEDPLARARWRRVRGEQDPAWLTRSDDELIGDAREAYERFGRKYASADDAAARWAGRDAWRSAAAAILPAPIYAHWSRLNIQRALRDEDSREALGE
jgi:hypothetical protein